MGSKSFGPIAGKVAAAAILVGLGILPPMARAAADEAPAAAPAGDSGKIEEVVINARKRVENIQEVPVAVTDIGARQLERDDLTNIVSFAAKLPSFTVAISNPKQTNIGVRGIGNNGANNDGLDPSVGVFIDGVYAGRLGEVTNDYNDLERIDLLRGPQGTLFGKNTIAGALQITTQKPSFTPEATVEGTLGTYNLHEFKGNVSGPVIENKLALRLAAFDADSPGFQKNADGSFYDGRQGQGARIQALATPNEDVTLRLIAAHDEQAYNVPVSVALAAEPGKSGTGTLQGRMAAAGLNQVTNPFSNNVNINQPAKTKTHTYALTGQADWDVHEGTITSITGYRNWYFQPYNDNDGTQLDAIRQFGTSNSIQQYSEELRWASAAGSRLESVVGLYTYFQDLKANQAQVLGPDYNLYAGTCATNTLGCQVAKVGSTTYAAGTSWGSHYETQDNADAIFGHSTWHVDNRLSFNVGLRQTWEWKTVDWRGYAGAGTSAATVNQINSGNFVNTTHAAVKDVSFGGNAGVSYKIDDGILTYFEYSRGSIAKGVNAPALVNTKALAAGAGQAIDPEKADAFEIGAKTNWFDHRLQVNAAAYDELVWGYQTTQANNINGSSSSYLANVGSIKSRGLELEVTARPAPEWRISAVGSDNLATYGSFHNGQCPIEQGSGICDYTGHQAPFAPRYTTDLNVEYDHELFDGVVGYVVADYNWRSTQNLTLTLSPVAQIGGYGITNLRIGTRLYDDAVDVSLWANNLTDTKYLVAISGSATTEQYTGTPGAPLMIGGTARVRF